MSECHTGKIGYRNVRAAKIASRIFANRLLARGKIVKDMYVYECTSCHQQHITRHAEWKGEPLRQIFIAAPVDMQLWAIGQKS